MSNHDRHFTCYFGILNFRGLMGVKDTDFDKDTGHIINSDVILPLYSHETYKIKTTFNRSHEYKGLNDSVHTNGSHFAKILVNTNTNPSLKQYNNKYYQKFFRKDVMWDFGDGVKKEGFNVEHSYKKPGRYKITCTFFDIDRKAWVNDYSITVTVKEVLPTIIKFDKNYTKNEINCSKIERIARLEAFNSNTIKKDLDIIVERIFSKEQHENKHEEIGKTYEEIKSQKFSHIKKYWSLLENQQTLFFNTNEIHSDYLTPSNTFRPKYNEIFGRFFYNEYEDKMDLSLYQVIPYKNIDENLKTIEILDPNSSILDHTKETKRVFTVNQVYTIDQLPSDVVSIGKRGWVDLFYKNDFIGKDNTFSIFYDIETENITGELQSAPNYLNINPIGFKLNVIPNNYDDVRIGYSLDGFLRTFDNENISSSEYFIDSHLYNTLFVGIDLDTFMFPYIPYGETNDYYIPKDISISVTYQINTINGGKNFSEIDYENHLEQIYPWFVRIPLILKQYVNIKYDVQFGDRTIMLNLVKKRLPSPNMTVIPKEIQTEEDIDRLLDVYMSHPMWNEKHNIRDMFKAILTNGDYLKRILTRSDNFLDDTANVKRCYLNNLISTLQMMGEDVTLFESGAFDGINDLRDFVRLLSMNHTELIGHVVNQDYDIRVKNGLKGFNVGETIQINDVIHINEQGKIDKVNDKKTIFDQGVDLIIHDKYTHDTKIVSFTQIYQGKNFPLDGSGTPITNLLKISDYEQWWGWNLLLPDSFYTICKKIVELSNKLNNRAISRNAHETLQNEIKRLKQVKSDLIHGYYSFHLLIPTRNNVRVGNFIDTRFVTNRIEDTQEWESVWGIAHEILMKILIEHGFLKNDRNHDFGEENVNGLVLSIEKYFEKKEIDAIITVGDQEQVYDLSGVVKINGEILDKTGNLLQISLTDALIANRDPFKMVNGVIECFVSDDGQIELSENTFNLIGNRVKGTLTVILGGSVQKPDVKVSAKLQYSPAITKKEIDEVIELVSPVYLDDVLQNNTDFVGKIRISGEIIGVGDNTLWVEFLSGTVLYNGEQKLDENGNPYDSIILEYDENLIEFGQQNELHIVVAEDGKIYQKIESYKIINDPNYNLYKSNWEQQQMARQKSVLPDGMMYDYRTALGEIKLIIEGEVSDIQISTSSSLFIKSNDFIDLPQGTEEQPVFITAYHDGFKTFKLYSTYERRFDKRYCDLDVKIENVRLNLYNPRYDYNLGKCWMDGDCTFSIRIPYKKISQGEWEFSNYPQYYYNIDPDISNYGTWVDATNNHYDFHFTDTWEFDNTIGDQQNVILHTYDLTEITKGFIKGTIECSVDGCIDDKIGVIQDGAVRDMRVVIQEHGQQLRGTYAALYDIDDTYDMTNNDKCSSLVLRGIKNLVVKNENYYPTLIKDGDYYRNDQVTIKVLFPDRKLNLITTEQFELNVNLSDYADLTHENMIFNVHYTFPSGEEIEGTITIGLIDSIYKVIDADLKFYSGWKLMPTTYEYEITKANDTNNLILAKTQGIATLRPSVNFSLPNRKFDLYVDYNPVEHKYFNIGGLTTVKDLPISSVFRDCWISEDGVFNLGNLSPTLFFYETDPQYTEFHLVPSLIPTVIGTRIDMDSRVDFEMMVEPSIIVNKKTIQKTVNYRWAKAKKDEDTEDEELEDYTPLGIISKTYEPPTLPDDDKWLSVNGDEPLMEDISKPGAEDTTIDQLETGGFKLKSSSILQDYKCQMSFEEVPTYVDYMIVEDEEKSENYSGVLLDTTFTPPVNVSSQSEEDAPFEIAIDQSGVIMSVPSHEIKITGTGKRTIRVLNEDLSTEETPVYDNEEYNYEINGLFKVTKGRKVVGKINPVEVYQLDFVKKLYVKPHINPEPWIEYDNETSIITDMDISGLINGDSMFYGHTMQNESSIPMLGGTYSRIASDFMNSLYSIETSEAMFEGCLISPKQIIEIIESLRKNYKGGSIEIGVHSDATFDTNLNNYINGVQINTFNWNDGELKFNTLPNPSDINAPLAEWTIKFVIN